MIPPSSELNPGKRRQMSVKVGFEGSEVSSQKPASVTVIFTTVFTKNPVVWQMFKLAPCTCNLINYEATLGNQLELTDMSEWQTHDFYDCDGITMESWESLQVLKSYDLSARAHLPSVRRARLVSTLPSMNLITANMMHIKPLTMDTLNRKSSCEKQKQQTKSGIQSPC